MAGEIVDSLKASTDAEQRARFITPPTQQGTRSSLSPQQLRDGIVLEKLSAEQLSRAEQRLDEAIEL
jgi:hypothetical protein